MTQIGFGENSAVVEWLPMMSRGFLSTHFSGLPPPCSTNPHCHKELRTTSRTSSIMLRLVSDDSNPDEVSSSRMKEKLDIIDKVRAALGGLKDNKVFYEELLSALPQFVACGPQSAGKSSVIRLVSGVSLPEASTLCTRIATMVQMRRSKPTDLGTTPVSVTLVGQYGAAVTKEDFAGNEPKRVRDAVEKAQ
jgi:Dynamin family